MHFWSNTLSCIFRHVRNIWRYHFQFRIWSCHVVTLEICIEVKYHTDLNILNVWAYQMVPYDHFCHFYFNRLNWFKNSIFGIYGSNIHAKPAGFVKLQPTTVLTAIQPIGSSDSELPSTLIDIILLFNAGVANTASRAQVHNIVCGKICTIKYSNAISQFLCSPERSQASVQYFF